MSEKTEKATPHQLQKAKEQGQVSKSIELNTCVFLIVMLSVISALGPSCALQLKQLVMHLFYITHRTSFSVDNMHSLSQLLLSKLIHLWLPFALASIITLILSTIAQTGFVWSSKPLVPDFKRIALSHGLKRLFSSRLIFDGLKNTLKLSLVCLMLYISLRHELPTLLNFITTTPENTPSQLMNLLAKVILQLLTLLLALAIIDKLHSRWKFAQDHRMSKQELKDEYRQREGDPKIKAKIRQLQHQLRQKTASLEQIKTADVVITNPTHLAIALKYDRSLMPAPKVVCKARGEMVTHVKLLASRHNVPIIENKLLARLLFATSDLNQWIDREHFPMVAMIFREVYRQKAAI